MTRLLEELILKQPWQAWVCTLACPLAWSLDPDRASRTGNSVNSRSRTVLLLN